MRVGVSAHMPAGGYDIALVQDQSVPSPALRLYSRQLAHFCNEHVNNFRAVDAESNLVILTWMSQAYLSCSKTIFFKL